MCYKTLLKIIQLNTCFPHFKTEKLIKKTLEISRIIMFRSSGFRIFSMKFRKRKRI